MVCLLWWAQDGVYTIIKELTVKIAVAFGKRIFSKMGQLKYFLCLCAALHLGAHGVFGKNIVEIGKPDASAAEFNDFGVDFNDDTISTRQKPTRTRRPKNSLPLPSSTTPRKTAPPTSPLYSPQRTANGPTRLLSASQNQNFTIRNKTGTKHTTKKRNAAPPRYFLTSTPPRATYI